MDMSIYCLLIAFAFVKFFIQKSAKLIPEAIIITALNLGVILLVWYLF